VYGTPFSTQRPRGTRWDNDFNRALWSWFFLRWNEQTLRMNAPSAADQFFGGATSNERDGWVYTLSIIEECEVNQRVSQSALKLACLMVADSFGLVDNATTMLVSLEDGTVPMLYNVDPPLPTFASATRGYEFKVWARDGGTPETGSFLTDTPSDGGGGTGTGGGGTGTGGGGAGTGGGGTGTGTGTGTPPGGTGGGSTLDTPSSIPGTVVTVAAIAGVFLLIAGASVIMLAPKEGDV
jgi:hypothetical protein